MVWFSKRKSQLEILVEYLQKRDEGQLALMEKMVSGVGEQAKVMQEYFRMFTDAPKPEVRSMTDWDEVSVETKLRERRSADDANILAKLPVSQPEWMNQMGSMFDDFKKDL